MKNNKKRRNDIILSTGVVVIAFFVLVLQNCMAETGAKVIVQCDGALLYEYSLGEDRTGDDAINIETQNGYNVLEIKDGKAYIREADCPDGLCMKQKDISRQGESLICLPHKLVISVEGAEEGEIDTFAY